MNGRGRVSCCHRWRSESDSYEVGRIETSLAQQRRSRNRIGPDNALYRCLGELRDRLTSRWRSSSRIRRGLRRSGRVDAGLWVSVEVRCRRRPGRSRRMNSARSKETSRSQAIVRMLVERHLSCDNWNYVRRCLFVLREGTTCASEQYKTAPGVTICLSQVVLKNGQYRVMQSPRLRQGFHIPKLQEASHSTFFVLTGLHFLSTTDTSPPLRLVERRAFGTRHLRMCIVIAGSSLQWRRLGRPCVRWEQLAALRPSAHMLLMLVHWAIGVEPESGISDVASTSERAP